MTVTISPLAGAGWQFFDNDGNPLSGGLIYTYSAGTSTPLNTYTTINGNIANSNPIVLDSAGRTPSEVWLTVGLGYKFVIQTANGVLIRTWDNIPSNAVAPIANDASAVAYEPGPSATAGNFIIGQGYLITSIGTTNFGAIGAVSNTVGTYFTATGVGSGTGTALLSTTVQAKLRQYVSVKDFGAVGDGNADDTVPIENAINANPEATVFFPTGTYKVTRQLNLTVYTYAIEGERVERGQNTFPYNGGRYSAVNINFTPSTPGEFLVNRYYASDTGSGFIGPFCHTNILFNLNNGSGFQFGNEALPIADGPGQLYVGGVNFSGCNFNCTGESMDSAADGTMTFSGHRAIGLCKAFESLVYNTSINGGDYGIRTYGCDKFTARSIRMYTCRPFDMIRVGSFGQQHTIDDFECEGWILSPIRNNDVNLTITNSSFEANIGTCVGAGRYALPSCTAAVTANSGTLTFSRSMDNILIPGWSLIELTDGTNTDTCFVSTVSGTTVTINTTCFRFTWSGTATTVTRIHTFGPLSNSGYATNITNIAPGAYSNCPSFVYIGSIGTMNITNMSAPNGSFNYAVPLAVGNCYGGQYGMNGQLVLNSVNAVFIPTTINPFIRVINANEAYGNQEQTSNRTGSADEFHSYNKAFRKWIYTPAKSGTSINSSQYVTFKQIAGDTGTSQQSWAWYLDSSLISTPVGSRQLFLYDSSLPSTSSGLIKIIIRAKSVTGTASVGISALSSLGGSGIANFSVGTTWKTFVAPINFPTIWGSSASARGIQITSDVDVYIETFQVIDDNPVYPFNYVDNTVGKSIAHNVKTLTFGAAATNIFTATSANLQSYKVKAYCTANDASGYYATVYAEYMVQVSINSGTTTIQGVSTIYKQAQSINAGIYAIDIVIGASAAAGVVTITAANSKTGTGSGTTGDCNFEVEAMGLGYSPITVV